jgi:hypothetical protein
MIFQTPLTLCTTLKRAPGRDSHAISLFDGSSLGAWSEAFDESCLG